MTIFYFENKKGGISLGISNNFDSIGRPVGGFSVLEMELDGSRLDSEGVDYLQESVNIFKSKTGCTECSSALQEMGVA